MSRDPFAFLATESRDRLLLLFLQAIIKKQGGEVSLSVTDLTSIDDGSALLRKTSDDGLSLVLSFARKGAEAYFLPEAAPSPSRTTSATKTSSPQADPPPPHRRAVHDDLDLALMEEDRAASAAERQRRADIQARRQSGDLPWITRPS